MFVVHARRIQVARSHSFVEQALDFCMWIEPYIAAAFLFIAGVSLVLSRERGQSGWLAKVVRRALGLAALSIGLFVPQYGLEFPDLVASSGILQAIALGLIASAIALESARPAAALALVAGAVLGVTFALDRSGAGVSGLNAGPGGAFPLIAFTALGALTARAWRRRGERAFHLIAVAAFVPFLLVLLSRARWTSERASFYHAHSGELALGSLFSNPAPRVPIWFWNHSALGAIALVLPLLLSLVGFVSLGPALSRLRSAAPLLLLGRHALFAYVLHLGLLGVADLAGLVPPDGRFTWALVALLTAAALLAARSLESDAFRKAATWRDRPPRGTPASDTPGSRNPRRQT